MSRHRGVFRDNTSRRATAELVLTETVREIESVLRTLSEREAGVIRLRFGRGENRTGIRWQHAFAQVTSLPS